MKQVVFIVATIFLALHMLVGSVGVVIDEHHCNQSGTSFYLFEANHSACDKKVEQETCEKNTCCSVEKKDSDYAVNAPSCCTSTQHYLYLDSDLTHHEKVLDVYVALLSEVVTLKMSVPYCVKKEFVKYRGPPPVPTNVHLSLLQTYLI